jgi:hypothetical protein
MLQMDVLRVHLENGKVYPLDLKKPIIPLEKIKKVDPYGEEDWGLE